MKKSLKAFIAFVFVTITMQYTAAAQSKSITIINGTGVDIVYLLYGSEGECETNYRSTWLQLSPNSSVTFNDPTWVPGDLRNNAGVSLGQTGRFVAMRIAEDHPTFHCSNNVVSLNDCFKAYTAKFKVYDGSCNATAVTATWTVMSTHSQIEFK